MHDEHLEHELALLKEKSVILVSPQFGNVSISYSGTIHVVNDHPMLFHILMHDGSVAIIFTVEDVLKLEKDSLPHSVIRLRGPHDYREDYSKV